MFSVGEKKTLHTNNKPDLYSYEINALNILFLFHSISDFGEQTLHFKPSMEFNFYSSIIIMFTEFRVRVNPHY